MRGTPSVLLLDDGELDRVHRMLKRLGIDYLRLQGRDIGKCVERPSDLLISSAARTLKMPELTPDLCHSQDEATWVCFHNQDFLPLRERLRGLGVHYLVQNALDEESLRLFLLQLAYNGPERRSSARLPLGGQAQWRIDDKVEPIRLAELSEDMCRVFSAKAVATGTAVAVILPASLGGSCAIELPGHTLRSAECESTAGEPAFSTVVRLDALEPDARAQLARILGGEQIGTRVTALVAKASSGTATRTAAPTPISTNTDRVPRRPETGREAERRGHARHEFERRVDLLEFDDRGSMETALGQDLSLDGVQIAGCRDLQKGMQVTLALYGGRREEPVVVPATVARTASADRASLRFDALDAAQRRQIARLVSGSPVLESLREQEGRAHPLLVTRVSTTRQNHK